MVALNFSGEHGWLFNSNGVNVLDIARLGFAATVKQRKYNLMIFIIVDKKSNFSLFLVCVVCSSVEGFQQTRM